MSKEIQIESLLHIIAISFAVGSAYIGLDRFRYIKRVKNYIQTTRNELVRRLTKLHSGTEENPTESSLTTLENWINEISRNGLGEKNFSRPMFGSDNKYGCDFIIVVISLSVQLVFLCIASLCPHNSSNGLFWSIFILSLLGILIPPYFIYNATKLSKGWEKKADDIRDGFAKSYNVSIEHMEETIKNNIKS